MRTVFMGTPEFAVPSLKALAAVHEVVGVFCQPDRPKGRSRKPVPCPVKEAALELGLPIYQPKRVRMKKWVAILQELEPDVICVAAFGQILSQKVLDIPPMGCVNVHASLLPRWRGASPIHHALKCGDAETGVGIMKMVLELDAGPVYAEASLPIDGSTRRPQLETALAHLGARLLVDTLPKLAELTPVPQDSERVSYAPIISKDFGYVNWNEQTARGIFNLHRAYEGWPAIWCGYKGQNLKLVKVTPLEETHDSPAGTIIDVTRKRLTVACAEQTVLQIDEVQPTGKKVQPIHAFINAHKPAAGEHFEQLQPISNS